MTHNCRSHPSKTNVKWELIDDEQAQNVVNVDEENRANQTIFSALVLHGLADDMFDPLAEAVWLCAHCLDLPSEGECAGLSRMKNHLNQA